jgi:hypothetical protein
MGSLRWFVAESVSKLQSTVNARGISPTVRREMSLLLRVARLTYLHLIRGEERRTR